MRLKLNLSQAKLKTFLHKKPPQKTNYLKDFLVVSSSRLAPLATQVCDKPQEVNLIHLSRSNPKTSALVPAEKPFVVPGAPHWSAVKQLLKPFF